MKFIINDVEWEIVRSSQEEINNDVKENDRSGKFKEHTYFGMCDRLRCKIHIFKELKHDVAIETLKHELMHCWIGSNGCCFNTYGEEDICNFSMASHNFIERIVSEYKNTLDTVL
jgi:hypothetical protein